MPQHIRQPRIGLTLIETLVSVAIMGVILGLALPAVLAVRERAGILICQNNLKDLGLAIHHHHSAKGTMPPYASGKGGEIYGGWFIHLMPYLGHDAVLDRLQAGQLSNGTGIRVATDGRYQPGVYGVMFPELECPSDPTRSIPSKESRTNYLANWYAFTDGVNGLYRPAQRFYDLRDGLTSVILFAEGHAECDGISRLALYPSGRHNFGITEQGLPSDDPYYLPDDYTLFQARPSQCVKRRTQTPHGVMNVAMADGSVRSVAPTVAPDLWKQLLKPRDGTPLNGDW